METFPWNAVTKMSLFVAVAIKGWCRWYGIKMSQEHSPVVCDGDVKYEEAKADRLVASLKNK